MEMCLKDSFGEFPCTGLKLEDPYLIGGMIAETLSVPEEKLKEIRIPCRYYKSIPVRRACVHDDYAES